ncbi:unnamed protein product [Brugia timori]|uniref:ANK_REP_REGION domain-containing protein n=1 Tax=Brugia timori TaxID=42155 RepID=A0A0R3QJG0_9BILA|nr:unnamed protein product [Brugia timori]
MTNFEFLQAEHVKLLQNHADLQKRYDMLAAAVGFSNISVGDASKLSFVKNDITIYCDGHQFRGHRLVIATRTDYWDDLSRLDRIEFKDITYNTGCAVLKWMYTDHVDGLLGSRCLMEILVAAVKYRFLDLQIRCELFLLDRIDCDSCLMLYDIATKNDLVQLKDNCEKMIKAKWNEFSADDFTNVSASLLYGLIKSYSEHVLHSIIRLKRSDILLLFFIEHFQELPKLCNEEVSGTFPLELALESDQIEIATSLVNHHADVNSIDNNGKTLLMRMLVKNKVNALIFLIQNEANFGQKVDITGENLLHIAASTKCSYELIEWLSSNLNHFDINDVDNDSKTPFIKAVDSENIEIIELLLQKSAVDINKMDRKGCSPISSALFKIRNMALAELIAKAGTDLNILYKGVFMIHHAVYTSNLDAVQFLCRHKVDVNKRTAEGMLPLQIVIDSENINLDLIRILMRSAANISLKISGSHETLLHHIIGSENDSEILEVCIENNICNEDIFTIVDTNGHTPIAKAVFSGKFQSAELLIKAGANVNEKDPEGFSLLKTIRRLCAFAREGEKYINASLLWEALQQGSFEIAKILTESGCHLNGCFYNENQKFHQTLLHKAIGLKLRDAAIFLIDAGCDIDISEQWQINGEKPGRDTPLLACIRSDFNDVAMYLIKRGARLDRKDAEGRSAVHLSIYKKNIAILIELLNKCNPDLLLDTDCSGNTPLDVAIETHNYLAAETLIKKAPKLITQVDENGEMLLHKTVRAIDLESVLFLISANFDVNACTVNESCVTALHLNAQYGSEIIMRNLILAGANVNAISTDGFTPLHVAAYNNYEALCMILLENGAQPNVPDTLGNTPLHRAVSGGSVACVNVLIGDSRINLRAVNKKQQNALFLTTGDLSRTNSLDILQMFLNADPQFPLDEKDVDGFTVFLLSYLKGNENMCHALLRCGVCLGTISQSGISVFKHVTPTKQLLFSLLDKLEREPCWADGHSCSECEMKFSLTMRKHHCRHCGRLVCARCSEQEVPILKYGDSQSSSDRPRLMSRFLTEAELREVFMLPEYTPRDLDLTLKEREFLNKASKVSSITDQIIQAVKST